MRFPLFDLDTLQSPGAAPSWSPGGSKLYVMAKPAPELARVVHRLDECADHRPPALLHSPIQLVGDRSWLTDADIAAACRHLSRVRYAPFLMLFDRIEGGERMMLSGGNRNCAAQDFRLAILDALFGHFERLPAYDATPHMTIDDHGRGRPGRLLDQPIAWLVEEFMLVESVQGDTRHVEWGRWRLRDD
ncbi:MAG TPA: hypothetical protein VGE65_03165 [Sphingobium sp.]